MNHEKRIEELESFIYDMQLPAIVYVMKHNAPNDLPYCDFIQWKDEHLHKRLIALGLSIKD